MMLSQLCISSPRYLWDKITARTSSLNQRILSTNGRSREAADCHSKDTRCELQQRTFCDHRVCCQVATVTEKDTAPPEPSKQLTTTENPAYGLSAENWLKAGGHAGDVTPAMDLPSGQQPPPGDLSHKDRRRRTKAPGSGSSAPAGRGHQAGADEDCPPKHSLSWSVLKHRQQLAGEAPEHGDGQHPREGERPNGGDAAPSVGKPHAKTGVEIADPAKRTPDREPPPEPDPLADMAKIKTEESIQEWLARIRDTSREGRCPRPAWCLDDEDREVSKTRAGSTEKSLQEALEGRQDTLSGASRASPASVPMVVMQCSRIHSHISSKPPFRQTSLPMGTLVTALYRESDWLYVQTPHGVEGFIVSSNCLPLGTCSDDQGCARRPWEPCDFPIEAADAAARRRQQQQRGRGAPHPGTLKMKGGCFYNDRCYFGHTFKSKDSIKTAKTVTDILRNSPETKVSNQ